MDLRSLVAAATVFATTLAGCGSEPRGSDRDEDAPPDPGQPQTSLPGEEVTVLTGDRPAALAIEISQVLFDRTPLVALAAEDDDAGQEAAAAVATELGVPLLLTPPEPDAGESDDPPVAALRDELARLAPATVLAVGKAAAGWADQVAGEAQVVPADPDRPAATTPPVAAPEPLRSVTVLAPQDAYPVAAAATAEAAGARVIATEATDPRTDPDLIAALADQPPERTVALGAAFGPAKRLRGRLRVAASGVELPAGGQVIFPGRRFVALYGHPGDPVLGVLGEQPRDQAIARAGEVAAKYEEHVAGPVVPALEIITTVASASRGPERDFSRRTPVDRLRPWVDAARKAGVYVVLDLQPGRTDFLSQAKEYRELLLEPHVGLALDPEWRLAPGDRHLEQIGSVNAREVNRVIEWLADLTAEHRLPQKLLVLHQFRLDMITNRETLDTGRDELAVLLHVDGFGTRSQKFATWRALHAGAPDVWWGWKNFYDEDKPTFSPAQTVAIEPSPRFISYQ